jgi:hypothetical protein
VADIATKNSPGQSDKLWEAGGTARESNDIVSHKAPYDSQMFMNTMGRLPEGAIKLYHENETIALNWAFFSLTKT